MAWDLQAIPVMPVGTYRCAICAQTLQQFEGTHVDWDATKRTADPTPICRRCRAPMEQLLSAAPNYRPGYNVSDGHHPRGTTIPEAGRAKR
jgi:predicted nucleic acid-binding Zn ribbon protein